MTEKIPCCGHTHPQPDTTPQHASHEHRGQSTHDTSAHEHHAHHVHGHAASHTHAQVDTSASHNRTELPAKAQHLQLHIHNMDCPTEEALIRKAFASIDNIFRLDFDLLNRILTVHHDVRDTQHIHQVLSNIGMPGVAVTPSNNEAIATPTAMNKGQILRMVIGGVAAFSAEALAWTSGQDRSLPIALLALITIFISGIPTLKKGWIALRHFTLNIHLLMTAAVLGATAIGQWPEAATVIWLFALAETIENASLTRARDIIRGLKTQAPETALVQQQDQRWQTQETSSIQIGQLIQIRPGDRIALDGNVEYGHSSVHQAAITGESIPVEKQPGDTVYAGSLNQSGVLHIRATATQNTTMLARIAQSVQDAHSQRAPTQSFVDRFAARYTPIVFAIALLMAILPPLLLQHGWHDSIYRALVLLVIACPCALVISTPVTVVSGLALAARRGLVVKGGLYLEQGKTLSCIAFDKTGTLTEGKPQLQQIISLSALDEQEVLRLAASLDAHSNHPLAHALLNACQTSLLPVKGLQLWNQGRGRGVSATIAGQQYHLGNRAMLAALQGDVSLSSALELQLQTLEQQGNTVSLLCQENQLIGMLAIADQLRAHSAEAMSQLHALGVRTIMLTGDNRHTAQAIASQAGIDHVQSQLLPDEKLTSIQTLSEQGLVGMCGDGINDAPALARADIGFAMATGSDTALDTADVALMQNDLRKIPEFIRISRQTSRLLWQNIAFALSVKALFFILALSGHASLWMAVFADTGTSLLVVLNGLRLLRYSPVEE
ncbi:heavy metal translocating P-type ATPase [Undibacterium sp. SXout7W]|uniref:heavy metal translocating P-type ATPase n=1 Tax=Undibacterium sp. SXout7W TaxID=3413049 RepID=UPI003BF07F62